MASVSPLADLVRELAGLVRVLADLVRRLAAEQVSPRAPIVDSHHVWVLCDGLANSETGVFEKCATAASTNTRTRGGSTVRCA